MMYRMKDRIAESCIWMQISNYHMIYLFNIYRHALDYSNHHWLSRYGMRTCLLNLFVFHKLILTFCPSMTQDSYANICLFIRHWFLLLFPDDLNMKCFIELFSWNTFMWELMRLMYRMQDRLSTADRACAVL